MLPSVCDRSTFCLDGALIVIQRQPFVQVFFAVPPVCRTAFCGTRPDRSHSGWSCGNSRRSRFFAYFCLLFLCGLCHWWPDTAGNRTVQLCRCIRCQPVPDSDRRCCGTRLWPCRTWIRGRVPQPDSANLLWLLVCSMRVTSFVLIEASTPLSKWVTLTFSRWCVRSSRD